AEDDRPEEESATFMYEEGYRAALRVMPRLLQLIEERRPPSTLWGRIRRWFQPVQETATDIE
ncbi:MAG: hypothetical protein D6681_14815, partial [Calditrichaeota bacterium]